MKQSEDTVGGWCWFICEIKSQISSPLTPEQIQMIMQKHHIKGHNPGDALEDLK